jgi:hypothetical protein
LYLETDYIASHDVWPILNRRIRPKITSRHQIHPLPS